MKTVLRTLLIAVSAMAYSSCGNYNIETEKYILPTPVEMQKLSGTFTFKDNMSIYLSDDALLPVKTLLQESLGMTFNNVVDENAASLNIILSDDIKNDGGYKLSVIDNKLVIYAADYNGARQLAEMERVGLTVNNFTLTD